MSFQRRLGKFAPITRPPGLIAMQLGELVAELIQGPHTLAIEITDTLPDGTRHARSAHTFEALNTLCALGGAGPDVFIQVLSKEFTTLLAISIDSFSSHFDVTVSSDDAVRLHALASRLPRSLDLAEHVNERLPVPLAPRGSESTALPTQRQLDSAGPSAVVDDSTGLRLPERVTLGWLARHVPVSFWVSALALLAAAFIAGMRVGNVPSIRDAVAPLLDIELPGQDRGDSVRAP